MKYLIFDFNGTIVNDIALSLESFNYCLNKYLNKGPLTLEEYRNIFCFPVIDYYKKVGFDFNVQSWEEVAKCWMDHYQKHHHECEIFDGVTDLIIEAHKLGYRCVVLSASETSILNFQLKEFGIFDYFDDVIAHNDLDYHTTAPIIKIDDCVIKLGFGGIHGAKEETFCYDAGVDLKCV